MAKYSANNSNAGSQQAVAGSYKTLLSITSSATVRRIKVYDFVFGTNGTAGDNVLEWDVSRQTAAGTGTSTTPLPLDPADAAALSVGLTNLTGEPTVTAASSLFYEGASQRNTLRWVCAPGGELVVPATSLAGFAFRVRSPTGYTSTATVTAMFEEQ